MESGGRSLPFDQIQTKHSVQMSGMNAHGVMFKDLKEARRKARRQEMIAHVAAVLMVPVVVRLEGPGRDAGTQTDPAEFPPRFCALAEAAYDDSKFMSSFPCCFSSWFVLPWFCVFCFFAEFCVIPWVVRFFAQQQHQPQQLTTTNNNIRNGHKSQPYQSRRKATKIGATVRAARDMRCGRFLC